MRRRQPAAVDREASMHREMVAMVLGIGSMLAAPLGPARAQDSALGALAVDTALRTAVERKDVPGVAALITDRTRVLYQGAFGVADVSTGSAQARRAVPYRIDDQAG